ncbi:MAG: hypothetical protein ACK5M7_08595 [Draconibacterium sp.]
MKNKNYAWAIAAVFIWIGFVGAISFMEAWLKFRAPGITIALGLGIGRLVFQVLNKIEIVLAAIVIINFMVQKIPLYKKEGLLFLIALGVLALQTVWLIPALDERAVKILEGQNVPDSKLHFVYIALELIKTVCLFVFGAKMLIRRETLKRTIQQ